MATVYVEGLRDENPRLVNTTGSALIQGQLTVIGGLTLIANEAIASGARGSFQAIDGATIQIAAADCVSGQATFGTANAAVYWKPSTGEFSDTDTATYQKIGLVKDVKNTADKIGVRVQLYAELQV